MIPMKMEMKMEKIKKFLNKWVMNNIWYKVLAIVFSFLVWLVITNVTDPTQTKTISNIPVVIQNESAVMDGTHVYTIESGETASIVVSGNKSILKDLNADDFIATANFKELSITNAVPIKIELTGNAAKYSGSLIISQKTSSMVINLENMVDRVMSIEVEYIGIEPENFVVEDATATPAMVTLRAPESVASAAARVVVLVNYGYINGNTTLTGKLIIYDALGNTIKQDDNTKLDVSEAEINITTNALKSVPVEIGTVGSPADGYKLSGVSCSKTSITIKGSEELLNSIEKITLPSELLDISGRTGDVSAKVSLNNYLPAGCSLYGDTDTITVTAAIDVIKTDEDTK